MITYNFMREDNYWEGKSLSLGLFLWGLTTDGNIQENSLTDFDTSSFLSSSSPMTKWLGKSQTNPVVTLKHSHPRTNSHYTKITLYFIDQGIYRLLLPSYQMQMAPSFTRSVNISTFLILCANFSTSTFHFIWAYGCAPAKFQLALKKLWYLGFHPSFT